MKVLEVDELPKGMQDFLDKIENAAKDGEMSFYTTDDWLEEFGMTFPKINGYYVTDENIIECI